MYAPRLLGRARGGPSRERVRHGMAGTDSASTRHDDGWRGVMLVCGGRGGGVTGVGGRRLACACSVKAMAPVETRPQAMARLRCGDETRRE